MVTGRQLDWWVKERREWWGRVRGPDGRQRWVRLLIFAVQVAEDNKSHRQGDIALTTPNRTGRFVSWLGHDLGSRSRHMDEIMCSQRCPLGPST